MRLRGILALTLLAAGCVTVGPVDPVPEDLATGFTSAGVGDGAIVTLSYFTPEQERSPVWEAARLKDIRIERLCSGAEIARRDVQWYEPVAPGEPRCAKIVYSVQCARRDSGSARSLDYARRQELLEDPRWPIGLQCGEKDTSKRLRDWPGPFLSSPSALQTTGLDRCSDVPRDENRGQILLGEVTYVRARTLTSPRHIRQSFVDGEPAAFLKIAARGEQRRHVVMVNREIPRDRDNVFIDQLFTDNGDGYCVTFIATQGDRLWRRTIRRAASVPQDYALKANGHSKDPDRYWDPTTDAHTLQHQFVQYLGLPIPTDHPQEAPAPRAGEDDARAGADPWAANQDGQSTVLLAARHGDEASFRRMVDEPGRPFVEWPAAHLDAAVAGGDPTIIATMLAQPHVSSRLEVLQPPFASAAEIEPLLLDQPVLANVLLLELSRYTSDRFDLVELALRHGANPNASDGRAGSILGAFSTAMNPISVKAVAALLKAGADPNLSGAWGRPAWIAVDTLKAEPRDDEIIGRANSILRLLLAAGADLNMPAMMNEPGYWELLFPYGSTMPDDRPVTRALLEMLVRNGLDLNLERFGKRALPLVEERAGATSELAITMRRLGARP